MTKKRVDSRTSGKFDMFRRSGDGRASFYRTEFNGPKKVQDSTKRKLAVRGRVGERARLA